MVQVMGMDLQQAFDMVQRHQPNHIGGHHCYKLVVDRLSAFCLQREEDQQLKDSVNSDRRGGGGCAAPGLAPQGLVHASISGESVFLLGAYEPHASVVPGGCRGSEVAGCRSP